MKTIRGIGPVIVKVCKSAPFGEFKESFAKDKTVEFRFQDTLNMIAMPLGDFGKSFNLPQEKEVMPYNLYTQEFIGKNNGIATWEEIKKAHDFDDFDKLYENLIKWDCQLENDTYDMIKYSAKYCSCDVDVLKNGWKTFRENWMEFADMDIFAYPTIASMGDAYLVEEGCYEGVHKIAGIPQRFIANTNIGGRVMCANNERVRTKAGSIMDPSSDFQSPAILEAEHTEIPKAVHVHSKCSSSMADFDGVSLYPSAMVRIPGFLKGAPKVLQNDIGTIWNQVSPFLKQVVEEKDGGYFVKIRVHTVGKKWRFPITCLRTEDDGNNWTNDLEDKEIYVNRFTLEDLIKHSKITYTILQGYYFDEGRNKQINKTMQKLFDMRLYYKDKDNFPDGNPLQLILKLIMNASYGITGLKPINTDVKYVKEEKYGDFYEKNHNDIKWWTRMKNGSYRFELYKQIDTHFNRQHVSSEVLAVSKNIMNEVMCLAETIGAMIYYTDTDSMHIDDAYVEGENDSILGKAFFKKYGKKLIGKKLGQFHTDFEFSGTWSIDENKKMVRTSVKEEGKITAIESIFLGKKSYIDKLQDAIGQIAYHIRLKGIPSKCIMAKVNAEFGGDPMKLFRKLYFDDYSDQKEKGVKFDLSSGGNCVFKSRKNHTMVTSHMYRIVRFPKKV